MASCAVNFTFTFNDNMTCRANVTAYEISLMVDFMDILNSNLCSSQNVREFRRLLKHSTSTWASNIPVYIFFICKISNI